MSHTGGLILGNPGDKGSPPPESLAERNDWDGVLPGPWMTLRRPPASALRRTPKNNVREGPTETDRAPPGSDRNPLPAPAPQNEGDAILAARN